MVFYVRVVGPYDRIDTSPEVLEEEPEAEEGDTEIPILADEASPDDEQQKDSRKYVSDRVLVVT